MSGCNFRRRSFLATSLALAGGLLFATLGEAGKPGSGGSAPPGRIYFDWSSEIQQGTATEDRGFWSMNADGSDKQLGYRPENASDFSYALHGGHRWFLAFGPSLADSRWALFAVRDDGHPDFTVQLLDEIAIPGLGMTSRWGKDDSFISFSATDTLNDVAEIWVAEVAFDDATGRPFLTAPPFSIVEEPQAGIAVYDFSPLGDEVVYTLATYEGDTSLMVKDLVTGETRLLVVDAIDPFWSPDGTKIAFVGAGIELINPDGTGHVPLTSSNWGDYLGNWSPDSNHIVFTRLLRKKGTGGYSVYSADVMRVSAADGSTVNLTKDIDGTASAAFWR